MPVRVLAPVALAGVCLLVAPAVRPSSAPAHSTQLDGSAPASLARPSADEFDRLAGSKPLAMLDACVRRAEADLRGYRAILTKQERIGGKLFPVESIRVSCREQPFAVRMIWDEGARSDGLLGYKIKGVRYAPGEKNAMVVYRPGAWLEEQAVDPRSADARKTARFGIEESGLLHALRRTQAAWTAIEKRGGLNVEYLGLQTHPDAGDRPCHVLRRKCQTDEIDPFVTTEPPVAVTDRNRADSFDRVTIWIDRETWLQVGTEQTRNGELVARYFFRITETNPPFGKDEFTPAALRK